MRVDNEASRAPTETIVRRHVVKVAVGMANAHLATHMNACAGRRVKDHTHSDGTLKFNQDMRPTLLPWSDAHAIDVSKHRLNEGPKSDPTKLDTYGAYMENHVGDYAMAYSLAILDYVTKDMQALAFSLALLPFRTRNEVLAYQARKYA